MAGCSLLPQRRRNFRCGARRLEQFTLQFFLTCG
jgi:hypothetical protein